MRARARVLYMGGGVENTGVVRSIRTSHGSIGACTTRVQYTFFEVNHLKLSLPIKVILIIIYLYNVVEFKISFNFFLNKIKFYI